MDGREMSFKENTFDYVIAGFIGWDNYFDFSRLEYRTSEPDPMIQEIKRVLKPNAKLGLSTWLVQQDLDWMNQFLTDNGITCRTNYSAENEAGWRIIMEEGGFSDIQFQFKSVSFEYETLDAWWNEMMDYDWIEGESNNDSIPDEMCEIAFRRVKDKVTSKGGVQFSRDALFVLGSKG
jgi:SAM-dependent methyltransferase